MEQLFIHFFFFFTLLLRLLFLFLLLLLFLPSSEAASAPPGAGWAQAGASLPADGEQRLRCRLQRSRFFQYFRDVPLVAEACCDCFVVGAAESLAGAGDGFGGRRDRSRGARVCKILDRIPSLAPSPLGRATTHKCLWAFAFPSVCLSFGIKEGKKKYCGVFFFSSISH